jgi:hypothetical protein
MMLICFDTGEWRDGEDQTKCVLAIEIETVEALFTNKTNRFVEGNGCEVIVFCFKYDLMCTVNAGMGKEKQEANLLYTMLFHNFNRVANKCASYQRKG